MSIKANILKSKKYGLKKTFSSAATMYKSIVFISVRLGMLLTVNHINNNCIIFIKASKSKGQAISLF